MNDKDYAILVGISHYPGIGILQAPERDAEMFREWLLAPDGGALPEENIEMVLSSQFEQDQNADILDTLPSIAKVESPFLRLIRKAMDMDADRLGRRLYLFFSGHGFSKGDIEESALLMANADKDIFHLPNFPGRKAAKKLAASGIFEEIVLIMDCCRDNYDYDLGNISWRIWEKPELKAKLFLAFAVPWGGKAKEKHNAENDHVESLFTRAVIKGLRFGKMKNGQLTSELLRNAIVEHYHKLIKESGLEYFEPDIPIFAGEEIVFREGADPRAVLQIGIAREMFMEVNKVEIHESNFQEIIESVETDEIDRFRLEGDEMILELEVPVRPVLVFLPDKDRLKVVEFNQENEKKHVSFK